MQYFPIVPVHAAQFLKTVVGKGRVGLTSQAIKKDVVQLVSSIVGEYQTQKRTPRLSLLEMRLLSFNFQPGKLGHLGCFASYWMLLEVSSASCSPIVRGPFERESNRCWISARVSRKSQEDNSSIPCFVNWAIHGSQSLDSIVHSLNSLRTWWNEGGPSISRPKMLGPRCHDNQDEIKNKRFGVMRSLSFPKKSSSKLEGTSRICNSWFCCLDFHRRLRS